MKAPTLRKVSFSLLALLFLFFGTSSFVTAQSDGDKVKLTREAKQAREYSLAMLDEMEEILREYYYDPTFRGIDLKARIETAKARVKTLEFNWQMYRVLVQVLMDFNDSHTRMLLPPRSDYFEYGIGMQMIGDECMITYVKAGSDAAKQGIEVGDQILTLGKFRPNRRDLWKMLYLIYKLDPNKTLELSIRKPDGTDRSMKVNAKTMTDKEYRAEQKTRKDQRKSEPFKCQELGTDLIACKLYSFSIEKSDIDKLMKQAAKYPKLILDLRGNGGGYVVVEQYLLSHFFDKEIKIADLVTRKKTETRLTKPVGDKQYKGQVAVLVDSNSASASEMTARVLQLEKRAVIYGDYSSGRVMTSFTMAFRSVMGALADLAIIRVGMSVTVADVKMRDGSRLENVGVVPDQVLLPSATALSKKMDAVLAYAATQFGTEVSPEKAGTYHFMFAEENSEEEESSEPN
jgi:C-terminal processing protease CtpA/Prc